MTNKGPFEILETKNIYENPWIEVREDRVVRPGGSEGIFGIVTMQAGATVLALDDDNAVYFVNEYKYAIGRDSLELVSGGIDRNETPMDTAKRELREELGFEAEEWIDLGVLIPFTTVIDSPNYMFMAKRLIKKRRLAQAGEILEPVKMPFERALKMALNSEIVHAASVVLILKAAYYMQDK